MGDTNFLILDVDLLLVDVEVVDDVVADVGARLRAGDGLLQRAHHHDLQVRLQLQLRQRVVVCRYFTWNTYIYIY